MMPAVGSYHQAKGAWQSTADLVQAIQVHKSAGDKQFGPSEANAVSDKFNALSESAKQDLLNFLRSL